MLTVIRKNNGYLLVVEYNGKPLHFKEWDATDACIYYMTLATLVDNGFATYDKEGCFVPFDSIYYLDAKDLELLGLSSSYPYSIRLRSIGDFKSPDFHYCLEYLTHTPDGDILPANTYGNQIELSDGRKYILSKAQYNLKKLVDRFNTIDEEFKTYEYNLRKFSEIKSAAITAGIQLDPFLDGENVFAPNEIKLEISRDGDSLTVLPSVDIKEKDKFKRTFDRQRRILDVYPISDDEGKRTRIVLNETQKENLDSIKKHGCRYSDRDEILNIIEHPTEYFDPDQFDLSEFYSERVIDLGFYKPKFYPFVSPYRSEWIVGATIEHPIDGTTNVTVESEDELQELENSIETAVSEEKTVCSYHETELAVEDAKFLAEMARKQLSNTKSPVKVKDDGSGKKVLIIEENAESTGYIIGNHSLSSESEYPLYQNTNIRNDFHLKAHQEEGVAWLQYLFGKKAPGCLMADDMGLGKTLQLLYFIDWHAQTHPKHKPYLIVAPVSLIENWQNEYMRFFSKPIKVTTLSSQQVPRMFDRKSIDMMQQCDIIITNYETVRNCQLNFCAVNFDIVVLDEAQKVKTPGALVTNAVKALKSTFRVAMTGTPVENTLLDLWCIMDFCVPGLLGNAKEFARKYQSPLKNQDTDLIALGNEIHDKLGIYFMRRLKADAAKDLPMKYEVKEQVNMPAIQEKMYRYVVSSYNPNRKGDMLVTIMGIREVSEHPYLHDGSLLNHDCDELIVDAARLTATISFLNKIRASSEKAILFAERKETQKMLQRVIRNRYGYTAKIINGDTPTSSDPNAGKQSRQSAIDDFQNRHGFGVIIMSPVAAGMGLNVTAANHVIHYSRHWNPAKENQATDRAYRIGQDKDVYVYYPMAVSPGFKSFDITLDELLSRKINLASSTIFPTERIEVKLEDFEQIFNI